MAKDGEILNSDLLQRLAAFLKIGGVRQYPKKLNLDEVVTTISLGSLEGVAEPGAGEGEFFISSVYVDMDGVSNGDAILIGSGSLGELVADGKTAFRIDHIEAYLQWTEAGLTAWNAEFIQLELGYTAPDGDPMGFYPICGQRPWRQVATSSGVSQRIFRWTLAGEPGRFDSQTPEQLMPAPAHTWNGRVPAYEWPFEQGFMGLAVRVRQYGAETKTFPAGTTFTVNYSGRIGTNGVVPRA